MKSRWVLLLVLACLAAVVAGCGSGSDSSSTGGGETTATETEAEGGGGDSVVAEAEAAAAKSEEVPKEIASGSMPPFKPKPGATIYFVNCDESVEGCANQYKGYSAAAKVLGWTVEDCDAKFEVQLAIQCFNNGINAGADAIVTDAFTYENVKPGFDAAKKAGIPVIAMFSGNEPNTPGIYAEIAQSQGLTQGQEVADWVIAESAGEANVLFVGETALGIDRQRRASFEEGIERCSNCSYEYLQFSQASAATQLPQQLQAALNSNPDIDYIVGTYDGVALAAANAVRNAGKQDSVKVVGLDANIPNLELIKKDEIQVADSAQGSVEPGWTAADATARVLADGEPLGDVPNALMIITPKNIGELPNGSFEGAIDFEQQFEELWEMK